MKTSFGSTNKVDSGKIVLSNRIHVTQETILTLEAIFDI